MRTDRTEAPACDGQDRLDPRVRRTRQYLKRALRELLAQRHLSEITVQDITERAAVNRATFYAHFEGKEDLVATMIREDLGEELRKGIAPEGRSHRSLLELFVRVVLDFNTNLFGRCPRQTDDFAILVGKTLQESVATHLEHVFEFSASLREAFPAAIRPRAVSMMAWTIYGASIEWCRNGRVTSPEEEARQIVALLLPN